MSESTDKPNDTESVVIDVYVVSFELSQELLEIWGLPQSVKNAIDQEVHRMHDHLFDRAYRTDLAKQDT